MWDRHHVVDADGHVMEPPRLWREYVDPAFADRCMRVERDELDGDRLIIDGRPSRLIRRLGGVRPDAARPIPDWNSLERGPFAAYEESCTKPSWDGNARLAWMDDHGVDRTLLFPSLGLIWPRELDPTAPYAVAHYRAYNRWIAEYASPDPQRLLPVAMLGLAAQAPAGDELRDLVAAGFRHVLMPLGVGARLGSELDPFWREAEASGVVVHLHKVAVPHLLPLPDGLSLRSPEMGPFFNHVTQTLPGQLFLTALLDARIPDRFPTLRLAFHECNAGWVPAWLDRATESYETLAGTGAPLLEHEPAHYVQERDTLFFSTGLGEDLSRFPGWLLARVLMATDYPHPGTPVDPRAEWEPVLAALPPDAAGAVLGHNAERLLGD